MLADRCGKQDRLTPRFTVTEGGQQAHISLLTARPTAERQTLTSARRTPWSRITSSSRACSRSYSRQAVVVPFDGRTPHAQYCYLKPRHLDAQTSYFDQVEQGML
jgi:hypothetical protein